MNPRLQGMVIVVGLMTVTTGGVVYQLATRQPDGLSISELRDAGAVDERVARWVAVCPEKITAKTRTYLRSNGYGTFAAGTIHRIARVVWEYNLSDGGRLVLNPSLISSLGIGIEDAGDEEDDTDDAFLFRLDDCYRHECNNNDGGLNELRLLRDGGFRHARADGGEVPWCSSAVRQGRVTPPCVIPNCWTLVDGGWNDSTVVNCRAMGVFGLPDGGARWRGCNVLPAWAATGPACVPVECGIVSGDGLDVLK